MPRLMELPGNARTARARDHGHELHIQNYLVPSCKREEARGYRNRAGDPGIRRIEHARSHLKSCIAKDHRKRAGDKIGAIVRQRVEVIGALLNVIQKPFFLLRRRMRQDDGRATQVLHSDRIAPTAVGDELLRLWIDHGNWLRRNALVTRPEQLEEILHGNCPAEDAAGIKSCLQLAYRLILLH